MAADDDERVVLVEHEPMHHELWRSSTLRALRADFPARSTCLWHEHRRYTVYVCITAVDVSEHKRGAEPVPLRLPRGFVLCRDHSIEPLVHRATTQDERVVMVGVEIQHARPAVTETVALVPDTLVVGERVHEDDRTRVQCVTLHAEQRSIRFAVETELVLVSLDASDLLIAAKNQDQHDTQELKLDEGFAVPLSAGSYAISLQTTAPATLYLVQILQ